VRTNIDVQDFFERVWQTSEGFRSNCPRCDDDEGKFYYNTTKGAGCCFHAGCPWFKENGGITERRLLSWFGHVGVTPTNPLVVEQRPDLETKLPDEFQALDDVPDELRSQLESYLCDVRGLDLKAVYRAKIGYCPKGRWWGYFIVPIFDDDGLVAYWQARRYKNREPKFYNPASTRKSKLVYQVGTEPKPKRVVVVESVFNALTLWGMAGTVTLALLGHSMSADQRDRVFCFERTMEEIVIMLDPDAWKDSVALAKQLSKPSAPKIKLVHVPYGHDTNSLGFEKSAEMIRSAPVYDIHHHMAFLRS
jgi:hypothetical protein